MPQPSKPKNDTPKVDVVPEGANVDTPKPGDFNPMVHALLTQADTLRQEKKDYLKRVDSNRSTLRMIQGTGFLSAEQRKAIDAFYPAPGSKKDTTTTADTPTEKPADKPAEDATPAAA